MSNKVEPLKFLEKTKGQLSLYCGKAMRKEKDPATSSPRADRRGEIFKVRGVLPVADALGIHSSFHIAAAAWKKEHRQ